MGNHWTEIEKYLEDQKIAQELIGELRDFHMRYEVEDQVKERVEKPDILFYGKKILEMSYSGLPNIHTSVSHNTFFPVAFGKVPSTNARNLEDLESWTKSIWQKMMQFLYCMPHWIIGAESIFQDITGFYFIRQHDLSAR